MNSYLQIPIYQTSIIQQIISNIPEIPNNSVLEKKEDIQLEEEDDYCNKMMQSVVLQPQFNIKLQQNYQEVDSSDSDEKTIVIEKSEKSKKKKKNKK